MDRGLAWLCLAVNQLATPGLGTLAAGRVWSGLLQLALAFGGFTIFLIGMFGWYSDLLAGELIEESMRNRWGMLRLGLVLFAVSWMLSLISSFDIIRRSGRTPRQPGPPPL